MFLKLILRIQEIVQDIGSLFAYSQPGFDLPHTSWSPSIARGNDWNSQEQPLRTAGCGPKHKISK